MAKLEAAARSLLKQDPIRLNAAQTQAQLERFQETGRIKGWSLLVVAVMADHVHLIVGLDESLHTRTDREALKSYGSRKLSERWGQLTAETW